MIKVHVSGNPVYINEDAIQLIAKNKQGRVGIVFTSGQCHMEKVDESMDEIYELICEEWRKKYSEFADEAKGLRVSC